MEELAWRRCMKGLVWLRLVSIILIVDQSLVPCPSAEGREVKGRGHAETYETDCHLTICHWWWQHLSLIILLALR
jgi:hypothetical protein